MATVYRSDALAKHLVAVGLIPDNSRNVTLRMEAGRPITIGVDFYMDAGNMARLHDAIGRLLREDGVLDEAPAMRAIALGGIR